MKCVIRFLKWQISFIFSWSNTLITLPKSTSKRIKFIGYLAEAVVQAYMMCLKPVSCLHLLLSVVICDDLEALHLHSLFLLNNNVLYAF